MALLTSEGFACAGWDPAYHPDAPRDSAEVVNLGYVINVVEDPAERAATLKQAWDLARRLLVVSAQVLRSGRSKSPVEFGDGVQTGRGTYITRSQTPVWERTAAKLRFASAC